MKTWLITLLVAGGIIAGGAGYLAFTFQKPSFGVIDKGDWGQVNDQTIKINSTVWLDNPNVIGLPLGFVHAGYAANANNITLAEGDINGINIETGNQTKSFTTTVEQGKIPDWWVSHLKNGEKSTITATVNVDLPLGSFKTQAFRKNIQTNITNRIEKSLASLEGTYKGPGIQRSAGPITATVRPEIQVKDFKVSWGKITSKKSNILMDVTLYNPNAYPIPTPSFAGNAKLNNVTVADWNANPQALTDLPEDGMIPPKQSTDVRFKASLLNQKMDEWFETHVKRGEHTKGRIRANLVFDFEGRQFKVPAGGILCKMNIQTAVLVDNQKNKFENKGCKPRLEGYSSLPTGTGDNNTSTSIGNQSLPDNTTKQDLLNSGALQ
ncbi:MAG: hypothetical protein ABEJ87_02165 [Candidatus Nanohalobium sp.]